MEENNFFRLINRYTDDDSCLFITVSNSVVRIYCPFRVVCNDVAAGHKKGAIYLVTKVISINGCSILYQIGENVYPHRYFKLITV